MYPTTFSLLNSYSPTLVAHAGPTYSYTYNSMGQLNTAVQTAGPLYQNNQALPVTLVQSASYNAAGGLPQITGNANAGYGGETRGYDSFFQVKDNSCT